MNGEVGNPAALLEFWNAAEPWALGSLGIGLMIALVLWAWSRP